MEGYSRTSCIAACSLYISPLDFYVWRLLKTLVHSSPIQNENTLHQSISAAYNTICNRLGRFEKVRQSMHDMMSPCVHWLKLRIFWAFVVKYGLIN